MCEGTLLHLVAVTELKRGRPAAAAAAAVEIGITKWFFHVQPRRPARGSSSPSQSGIPSKRMGERYQRRLKGVRRCSWWGGSGGVGGGGFDEALCLLSINKYISADSQA